MKSSVQNTYNENRSNLADARRLLFLSACVLGIMMLLVAPFRVIQKGKPTQIVYAPVWDPPQVPDKYTPKEKIPPDGGLFVPLLLAQFAVLTVVTLVIRDRLSKGDLAKLESYPGYQRGF